MYTFTYTSDETTYETAYEAFYMNAPKNAYKDSREDSRQSFGLWNLPTRQDLSLEEQDDLSQQRLKEEKWEAHQKAGLAKEVRQNATLAATTARIGKTMNQQRAYFHEKSRPFALEPNEAREPLPAAVGDLTLKKLALQRIQASPVVAVAPLAPVVPATAVPFLESSCGAMFETFVDDEDFYVFRRMLAAPAVLTSPRAIVTIRPAVPRVSAYDIFTEEEAIFGDFFAGPAVFGAPTVPYISASPAVMAPAPVASVPVVAAPKQSSPLSKHDMAIRELKLKNKGSDMGALIEIYQEMEANGQITHPVPIQEPVIAVAVVSAPAHVIPDMGSDEEVSSGSEKGSTNGSPSSQSSLSDEEDFLHKFNVTPMPTPTKARALRPQTPVKATPMKAFESNTLQTPSPMRLEVQEKTRPDSPTTPESTKKLTGRGKTFTPSLAAIELSPAASPFELKAPSPPASPFLRPGNPTPTKAGRGARTRAFAPILSPIASSDFEEEQEEPSSPAPMLLGGILPTTTTFAEEAESALDSVVPTIQMNGAEVVAVTDMTDEIAAIHESNGKEMAKLHKALDAMDEKLARLNAQAPAPEASTADAAPEIEEELPEVPLTNTGALATIACSYLIAQGMRTAPITIAVFVGAAAFAAYRFFDKKH